MDSQDQFEVFDRLGLTFNQTKIFITLAQSEPSTVIQIAKATGIAREVVYRTMPTLQKMGLINKAISFPIRFSAIPFEMATKLLVEKREKEISEVKAKAFELIKNFRNKSEIIEKKEPQIVSIIGRERLSIFTKMQMSSTKLSMDTMMLHSKFYSWWEKSYPIIKKLLAGKVKIRILIISSKQIIQNKDLDEFIKNPYFTIKFIPDDVPTIVGIIDDKDILINTSVGKASVYWSNDPGVIHLCKVYFEKYWNLKDLKI